ncbi:MAG: glutamate 5-kinase [Candidatus Methanomethylophilaceae archaeon]
MTDRASILSHVDTVVVKVGTSSITGGGNSVSETFMDSVARQVRELRDMGKKVLIVSSGAIGVGLAAMNAKPKPKEIPIRQAAASVGQGILMQKWNDSFEKQGLLVSQILLTYDFYSDREKYLNLRNAIQTLLAYGVVPIINENDVVCVKEIDAMFGDNDTLSAYVCSKMDADLLIILSDVEGLYNRNPKIHPDAEIVPVVDDVSSVMDMAGDPTSRVGTGGMKTKLRAAEICHEAGCYMIIAGCDIPDVITRTVRGEDIGTIFLPGEKERKKSRWIKAAHAKGSIIVDSGAAEKLRQGDVSLLAVGIRDVIGRFERGDVVNIECSGKVIAKGIPDYDSEDIFKIRGIRSDRIEAVLGHKSYDDVIRSENLVLM